ncbi:hypothetical protein PoB_003234500 [Plakobranchus ocellatus]|uniref:Uncharacterized protein n=1 Tax=Plakobranchus ocellatus TaxID=259542 RepID=A0AAV4AEM9_9GAST|nr:hypothetical protein PoB_003234500 [Plakobranchus ocellatus]
MTGIPECSNSACVAGRTLQPRSLWLKLSPVSQSTGNIVANDSNMRWQSDHGLDHPNSLQDVRYQGYYPHVLSPLSN